MPKTTQQTPDVSALLTKYEAPTWPAVVERMTREQFAYVELGGGCDAFDQSCGEEGAYFRCTINCEPSVPLSLSDADDEGVTLGYYEDHACVCFRVFPSVAEMLDWMSAAEYLVPTNGGGIEANGWTKEA